MGARAVPSLLGRSHGSAVSWFYLKSEHLVWTDTEGLCLVHSSPDQPAPRRLLMMAVPWGCWLPTPCLTSGAQMGPGPPDTARLEGTVGLERD